MYTTDVVGPVQKEYKTETTSTLLFNDQSVKFYTFVWNFTCLHDLFLACQRHWRIINTIVTSPRLTDSYKLLFMLTGDAYRADIKSSATFVHFQELLIINKIARISNRTIHVYDNIKCLLGEEKRRRKEKISWDFKNVHIKYERKWRAQFEIYEYVECCIIRERCNKNMKQDFY